VTGVTAVCKSPVPRLRYRRRTRKPAHRVKSLVDAVLDQGSYVRSRRVRLLSVISPTLNEIDNVEPSVRQLTEALVGLPHEILIVDDDSKDQTWRRDEELAGRVSQLRLLRRLERHGLGFAIMDGFAQAAGDAVACIDSDLQHDPAILPQMVAELERGAGLVVVTAILVHSFVDFNLQIPANAALFYLLAAIAAAFLTARKRRPS